LLEEAGGSYVTGKSEATLVWLPVGDPADACCAAELADAW
jgi:hypothetical protein